MIELTESPVRKKRNNVLGTSELIQISKEGRLFVKKLIAETLIDVNQVLKNIFHLEDIDNAKN
jgi:hypothetical protein